MPPPARTYAARARAYSAGDGSTLGFLSRLARRHPVLFVEEPWFDLRDGEQPRVELHQVMPNVAVAALHMAPSWRTNGELPGRLVRGPQTAAA